MISKLRLRYVLVVTGLALVIASSSVQTSGQVSQSSDLGMGSSSVLLPPASGRNTGQEFLSPIEAINQARKKVQANPDSASASLNLGLALWRAGNDNAAEKAVARSLKLDPRFSKAWYYKALLEGDQDKWESASQSLQKAIALKPDYLAARIQLGGALLRQGDFNGAQREWAYVKAKDPSNVEARYGLGLVFMRQGRMTDAEAEFRTAIRLSGDRGYPEAAQKLGETLLRQRKWQAAAQVFRKVLGSQPASIGAINGLATALARLGDVKQSRQEFAKAQAILQKNLKLQRAQGDDNHGLQLWMAGDLPHAADYFRRAIKDAPSYAEAHNNLGGVLWQQNQRQEAIAEFKAATRAKPDSAQAHNNLGSALFQTGEVNGAISQFRSAIAYAPGLVMAHYNLAVALSQSGNLAKAEEQFRQVIALQPTMAAAHIRLGLLVASRKKKLTRDSRRELREGLRLNPELSTMVPSEILRALQHQPKPHSR